MFLGVDGGGTKTAYALVDADGNLRSSHVGASVDYLAAGIEVARDLMHIHDFQATVLHQLGLDHTKLTFRHAGRDFRLTDVGGHVVNQILA